MMWKKFQNNPLGKSVGDCSVRAISKLTGMPWVWAYVQLCIQGLLMADLPNSDAVWGAFLRDRGFRKQAIPDSCPNCYTVADFAADHPYGMFAVGTGSHVVCIIDGSYYDSWDSGSETPIFYWGKTNGI